MTVKNLKVFEEVLKESLWNIRHLRKAIEESQARLRWDDSLTDYETHLINKTIENWQTQIELTKRELVEVYAFDIYGAQGPGFDEELDGETDILEG